MTTLEGECPECGGGVASLHVRGCPDDLSQLPFAYPSTPTPNGASGRKPCTRHPWKWTDWMDDDSRVLVKVQWCARCHKRRDPIASRRSRNNGKRGRRAELDIARSIPGGVKMGPLGLPWDVEVGTYARLQVKKLIRRPGPAEIARLIAAIPDTGDRLRGFVWVEAAGQGKHGQRLVWFTLAEWLSWHGWRQPVGPALVMIPLDEWAAEYVTP